MKLSDAIEQGSKHIEWASGVFLHRYKSGKWSGCALGAAAVGTQHFAYKPNIARMQIRLAQDFPELQEVRVSPPDGQERSLIRAIMVLNDQHKWNFKQIVEWLRKLNL